MKKLLVIIAILLVIFVGMLINQNIQRQAVNISMKEVNEIEGYIEKIYLWKEVTSQAIPKFETIKEAEDRWIWGVVKKNLDEYELDKQQIQDKAKELFGEEFNEEYSEQKNKAFSYSEETKKYYPTEITLDKEEDLFLLNTIQKTKDGYKIEIIEYLVDYANAEEGNVEIKNVQEEMVASVDSSQVNVKALDLVKENKDKFTKKEITLKKEEERLYVIKVE